MPEGNILDLTPLTWKVFGNMKKNHKGSRFSGTFTPLFPNMLLVQSVQEPQQQQDQQPVTSAPVIQEEVVHDSILPEVVHDVNTNDTAENIHVNTTDEYTNDDAYSMSLDDFGTMVGEDIHVDASTVNPTSVTPLPVVVFTRKSTSPAATFLQATIAEQATLIEPQKQQILQLQELCQKQLNKLLLFKKNSVKLNP